MPFHIITHLITHPGRQRELAAIFEFRLQLTFKAQQHMPTPAPVIGQVAGGLFDHAHTGSAKVASAPPGTARNARMKLGFKGGPIGDAKRDSGEFHGVLARQLT